MRGDGRDDRAAAEPVGFADMACAVALPPGVHALRCGHRAPAQAVQMLPEAVKRAESGHFAVDLAQAGEIVELEEAGYRLEDVLREEFKVPEFLVEVGVRFGKGVSEVLGFPLDDVAAALVLGEDTFEEVVELLVFEIYVVFEGE